MPTRGLLQEALGHPLLFVIMRQKPLQVNHQHDAQSEKQKRKAVWTSRFAFRFLFSTSSHPEALGDCHMVNWSLPRLNSTSYPLTASGHTMRLSCRSSTEPRHRDLGIGCGVKGLLFPKSN